MKHKSDFLWYFRDKTLNLAQQLQKHSSVWNCTFPGRSQNILWFFFSDMLIVLPYTRRTEAAACHIYSMKVEPQGLWYILSPTSAKLSQCPTIRGCNNTPSFENAGRLMNHFNSMKADWDHLPVIGTWRKVAALVNHFHTSLLLTLTLKRHYHTSQSSFSTQRNFPGLKMSLCCGCNDTHYFLYIHIYIYIYKAPNWVIVSTKKIHAPWNPF